MPPLIIEPSPAGFGLEKHLKGNEMEKEGFRENLDFLVKLYPDRAALDVKEVASVLGISAKTVYEQISLVRDPLPSKKIGGKIVIPIVKLAAWML